MFWSTVEYGVSTSIGYGVSSFLSNTSYSSQQINTAYPLPLDTTYQSSGIEAETLIFVPNYYLSLRQILLIVYPLFQEDLKTKFLNKYCPPGRTAKKIEEVNNFPQEPDETLYQERERFKELLMKCPQHYLTEIQEVILFYNGLDVPTRQILDSRGVVPTKTAANAKKAIQEMAEYS
ncbi:hypothetical protein Tco_1231682 [Tanacetum coccineum]